MKASEKLITNPLGAIDRLYGNYLPTTLYWFHDRQDKLSRIADVRVELQNTKALIGAEPWFRLACQKSDN